MPLCSSLELILSLRFDTPKWIEYCKNLSMAEGNRLAHCLGHSDVFTPKGALAHVQLPVSPLPVLP